MAMMASEQGYVEKHLQLQVNANGGNIYAADPKCFWLRWYKPEGRATGEPATCQGPGACKPRSRTRHFDVSGLLRCLFQPLGTENREAWTWMDASISSGFILAWEKWVVERRAFVFNE